MHVPCAYDRRFCQPKAPGEDTHIAGFIPLP
jgi:hypothetical protein